MNRTRSKQARHSDLTPKNGAKNKVFAGSDWQREDGEQAVKMPNASTEHSRDTPQ